MKKRFISFKAVVLLFGIIGFTSTLLSGQVYVKEGSSAIDRQVIKGDTTTLKIQTYRGTLQWQESENGTTWQDISGQTESQLKLVPLEDSFVRVSITDENCDPVYSVVVHLITVELPTVLTGEITNITTDSARCGGAVTHQGEDAVWTRGICCSAYDYYSCN